MKVTHTDLKNGLIKIRIDDAEDKWVLEQIIEPGDLISGMTERKIKIGGSDEKSKISRRHVYLKIKSEKIDSDNILRITGPIIDAPDDIPKGDYHTFNLEDGETFGIEKARWPKYMVDKLFEASNLKANPVLIVAFDREEAIFALLKNQGYEILLELKGDVAKKDNLEGKKLSFYAEVIKQMEDYDKKHELTSIILASPAFWKEYLLKELQNDVIRKKIVLATCSAIDGNTINEILKRPELKTVLERDKSARETKLIEELLLAISKGSAGYGLAEVGSKLLAGNVSVLIVSESLIKKSRKDGTFFKIDKIMRQTEDLGAETRIISSEDALKKIDGLSGIACLSRWKENY